MLSAYARFLKQFCENQTWKALRDLLGFAKTVLAAPDRRGRLRTQAVARDVDTRAGLIGVSDFGTLWERTTQQKKVGTRRGPIRPDGDMAERAQDDKFCRTGPFGSGP